VEYKSDIGTGFLREWDLKTTMTASMMKKIAAEWSAKCHNFLCWRSLKLMSGDLKARIASVMRTGKARTMRRGCQLKRAPVLFSPSTVGVGLIRRPPIKLIHAAVMTTVNICNTLTAMVITLSASIGNMLGTLGALKSLIVLSLCSIFIIH